MPTGSATLLRLMFTSRMLVSLLMGFACGLPLLLTASLLQAWMQEEGVDLGLIGLMALVGLPYTVKFLWAPILDRFTLPFLGRRRGWLLTVQVALMASITGLGFTEPAGRPLVTAFAALLVAFFSASQDILVDAYRREDLSDEELGLGSSLYINGYRVGMLLASGGGFILADHLPFSGVYAVMAACLIPGVVTTMAAPEPPMPMGRPARLTEAVIEPLADFLRRKGALWMLAFILLYKMGDTMASAMTTPFYLDIGFTKTEIGTVVKLFGFWATVAGGLAAGVMMFRLGIHRALWVFGVLQALSTAGFAVLAGIGHSVPALCGVIGFENLSGGMGTAAFAAFMASITNRKFTATQYALLTSLMGVPRVMASAPTGYMAAFMGWGGFFIFCTLMAVPGLLLLPKFAPWRAPSDG